MNRVLNAARTFLKEADLLLLAFDEDRLPAVLSDLWRDA